LQKITCIFEPTILGINQANGYLRIKRFFSYFLTKTRIKMKRIILFLALIVCFATTISAQWQPTTGIYGGNVYCSAANNSNIFIGTRSGVYLSTNNGATWAFASNGLPYTKVYALAIDGINIYASVEFKGVYRSTNNGQTWVAVNTGLSDLYVTSFAISGNKIYVGTYTGVFYTTNNGNNWDKTTDVGSSYISSVNTNGSNVFAGTTNGVYISNDNGNSWIFKRMVTINNDRVQVLASNGNKIVAGTSNNVFLSTDNGQNWTKIGLNEFIYSLAIRDNTLFVGTFDGVKTTSDNGVSWRSPNDGLTRKIVYTMTLIGSNIMVGTAGSVYFSTIDGNLWTEKNNGFAEIDVSAFATFGNDVFATTIGGNIYVSQNNQNTWVQKPNFNSENRTIFSITAIPPLLFVAEPSHFWVSNDNGDNWTISNTIQNVFELANKDGVLFAAGGSFLKSNDNGVTWIRMTDLGSFFPSKIRAVGNKMYAINYSNLNYKVHVSSDNGNTWTNIHTGIDYANTSCVTAVDTNVLIGTPQGVLLSRNNRFAWTSVNTGLSNVVIADLAVNGNTIYTATYDGGIFMSNNLGGNWVAANDGLPVKYTTKLFVAGNYLYAVTPKGVFKRPLSELVVGTNDNQDINTVSLSPNPASNQLTINASNALLGRRYSMTNILGEIMQSGILTDNLTVLSVHHLANGVYFLLFNGLSKSIKFVKE
jgi:photosystem II stability/assembly factor-like uncharacterized protein